jgi:adenylate kinase
VASHQGLSAQAHSVCTPALVILLGPPGAGKGTVSAACVDNYGWSHVSTGNLLRQHINQKTELGQRVEPLLKAGSLVDDETMVAMIGDYLISYAAQEQCKPLLFDGFPRTKNQAFLLAQLLSSQARLQKLQVKVVLLKLDPEQVKGRLIARLTCENAACQAVYAEQGNHAPRVAGKCDRCGKNLIKRSDDRVQAIDKRLTSYYTYEADLLGFYRQMGTQVQMIDAAQTPEKVVAQVCQAVNFADVT